MASVSRISHKFGSPGNEKPLHSYLGMRNDKNLYFVFSIFPSLGNKKCFAALLFCYFIHFICNKDTDNNNSD